MDLKAKQAMREHPYKQNPIWVLEDPTGYTVQSFSAVVYP